MNGCEDDSNIQRNNQHSYSTKQLPVRIYKKVGITFFTDAQPNCNAVVQDDNNRNEDDC